MRVYILPKVERLSGVHLVTTVPTPKLQQENTLARYGYIIIVETPRLRGPILL